MKLKFFLVVLAILFPINIAKAGLITKIESIDFNSQQYYSDFLVKKQKDQILFDVLNSSVDIKTIGRVIFGFKDEDEFSDDKTSWRIGYYDEVFILMYAVEF